MPQRDKYFRILKTHKKCHDSTESYSTTAGPKMLPTLVASSLD
jgi:hypothetical protein